MITEDIENINDDIALKNIANAGQKEAVHNSDDDISSIISELVITEDTQKSNDDIPVKTIRNTGQKEITKTVQNSDDNIVVLTLMK